MISVGEKLAVKIGLFSESPIYPLVNTFQHILRLAFLNQFPRSSDGTEI